MQILTWTGPFASYKLAPLIASSRKHNIRIRPILCFGLIDKIRSLRKAIRRMPDNEIVVCLDGYDCLILRPFLPHLPQRLSEGKLIVFSCQKTNEHHFRSTQGVSNPPDQVLYWLNSGIICSTVSLLDQMFQEIDEWNLDSLNKVFQKEASLGSFNDQSVFGHYQQLHPNSVLLDTTHFLSKTSVYEPLSIRSHDFSTESVLNVNQDSPSVLHFPFTTPDLYIRFLEIATSVLDRELAPHEIDLNRLKRLSASDLSYSDNATRILNRLRETPRYASNLARQSCLQLLERCYRKTLRAFGTLSK